MAGLGRRLLVAGTTRALWPLLRRRGEPSVWRERWYAEPPVRPVDLWLHTASLGEIAPLIPLLEELEDVRMGVTVTSGRSFEGVAQRLGEWADVRPMPLPYSPAMAGLVAAWSPRRLILLEAELWPDMVREIPALGGDIAVLGGRARFPAGAVWRRFLRRAPEALHGIWVASTAEAEGFRALGLPADHVHSGFVPKLLQAAAVPPDPDFAAWPSGAGGAAGAPLLPLVAGSIHRDEVHVLAAAVDRLRQAGEAPRLLAVPRHPERAAEIAAGFAAAGLSTATWPEQGEVTVVDRFGVLAGVYGRGEVALVGGSWMGHGGHNPVEALAHGVPVVMGPSNHNQQPVLDRLEPGLVRTADTAEAIADAVVAARAAGAGQRERIRQTVTAAADAMAAMAREALVG